VPAWLLAATLVATVVFPAEAAKPKGSNLISGLSVSQQDGATVIQVEASSRPQFTVFRLDRPPRLTVDLANCGIKGIPRLKDVDTDVVRQVATRQFRHHGRNIARIMISLRGKSHYSVKARGRTLVVTISARGAKNKREAQLSVELSRLQRELAQQKAVTRAAVEAATHLRQVAMETRRRLGKESGAEARRKALDELRQVEQKLARAEQDRKAADAERKKLQRALRSALRKAGELERRIRRGARTALRDIRFVDRDRWARVEIELGPGDSVPAYRVDGASRTPVLELDGAKLPTLLQRTLDTSEFGGPVTRVSSYATGGGQVAVKVVLRDGKSRGRVSQIGRKLVWSFPKSGATKGQAAARPSTDTAAPRGRSYTYRSTRVAAARVRRRRGRRRAYSGRRIDLDFKDADLHNILRLLSEVGNINIITSDKVGGRVTIRMKNVPWDQALDVILRAKGLGQVREGNLVRVAPAVDLEKEREAEIARMKQVVMLKPLETRLIPVSYAQAAAVLPKIRYMMSPRGKLTVDRRTNMVIARDISGNLDLMERLVRNLDTQTPQVLIEARIVEARTNFAKEAGIQWGGEFTASSANGNSTGLVFPNQIGIAGAATDGQTPTEGILLGRAANPNFAVNMPAPIGTGAGGGLGLTLGSVSGNVNVNLRLSALETEGDIRIVSSPKITTLDNVQASIEQGVTIPYSQVSAAGVQTTFKDAKLNLTVTPHVTADGSINMKVQVTNNEPDFVNTGPRGEPTILKKQAQTEMLIKDGDTAVIGGIYSVRTGTNWSKVPWFAEIPILGYFFRHRRDFSDRQEVLVFITPRIINRAASIGR
jgi:type IV pilus assembly protein PilQ